MEPSDAPAVASPEGPPRWRIPGRLLSPALLVGLTVWLFRDIALRGRVLYERDIFFQWWPQTESFVRVVAGGSLPLWNPWGSFGQPMLANANMQVAYPSTWLSLLMPAPACYTVFVLAHVLLGAAGTLVLARRLGLSAGGSRVAAAVWMASGPALSLASLWNHLAAAAWMPWSLAAAHAAVHQRRPRAALAWGATLAAQVLAGSPDVALFSALLSAALVATQVEWRQPLGAGARATWKACLLAVVLALGLSAVQWLPSVTLLRQSSRQEWSAWEREFWSAHPALLPQLVAPAFLHLAPLSAAVRETLYESREPYLSSHYLGLAALGLIAAAMAGRARPFRSVLLGALVVATVFALGRHTPFYALATAALPPLRLLRFPSKALIVTAFAWALLAGMGYDALREGLSRRRLLVVCGLMTVVLAAAATWIVLTGPRADVAARWLLVPTTEARRLLAPVREPVAMAAVLGTAALLAAAAGARGSLSGRTVASVVAGLAVLDLAVAHASLNPTAPAAIFAGTPRLLDQGSEVTRLRSYVYDYVQFPLKARQHLHQSGLSIGRLPPGTSLTLAGSMAARDYGQPSLMGAFGIETSFDFDLLGLQSPARVRLSRFLCDLDAKPAPHLRLLRLAGVHYVVSLHPIEGLLPVTKAFTLFPQPILIDTVPDALPRHYLVSGVRRADARGALPVLVDPDFDPAREVLLEDEEPRPPDPSFSGDVRLVERAPDHVRLDATASGDGWLVLLDGYDPGWQATVDGQRTAVHVANTVFRAVRVPPGRHVVDFTYRPWSATAGLAATLLTAVAGAILFRRQR